VAASGRTWRGARAEAACPLGVKVELASTSPNGAELAQRWPARSVSRRWRSGWTCTVDERREAKSPRGAHVLTSSSQAV
jgi:hypothetical protein